MNVFSIIIAFSLFLSAVHPRLINRIESDDDFTKLIENLDHASIIYFTKEDCENCELAFDIYKQSAKKLRGIIRTYEINCDTWHLRTEATMHLHMCEDEMYEHLP